MLKVTKANLEPFIISMGSQNFERYLTQKFLANQKLTTGVWKAIISIFWAQSVIVFQHNVSSPNAHSPNDFSPKWH
jgi:hypothetical protein